MFKSFLYVCRSATSLCRNLPDRVGVQYRPIYEANARTPEGDSLYIDDQQLMYLGEVLQRTNLRLDQKPYWNPLLEYDVLNIFGSAIQSVDLHDATIPEGVFPPERDIEAYIKAIVSHPYPAKIPEQFEEALMITDNHILGALNLCWAASRFMARGADQRAYPSLPMNADIIRGWNGQISPFETYNNSGLNDAPGDTYYFWTHAFGAAIFNRPGWVAGCAQFAFGHGTQIMMFVRQYIARRYPNITAHAPASDLGRAFGLALANLYK